ncbi:MAG: nicotinamide mononucleotide transporter, partial [Acutalibacteraceae bacterium]|nr:nicotinamide mononucleotide transporter [Acutalibacteraceae bacterium]
IEVDGGIFANNVMYKNIACYLDACVSAVGIANGLFILFRYREQWIAWYISAILETVINIMAGQYVLLVLKAGYLTNTTYGYIKWTKYIKSHKKANAENTLAKTE